MKYQFNDAGRAKSKRPKQKNDCVVRALTLAFEKPYDEIYEALKTQGRKCSSGTKKDIWKSFLTNYEKLSFPAIKGKKRMNSLVFNSAPYNKGIYIVQTAKHLYTQIDGIIFDTFEPELDRCVYCAYKIK